MTNESISVLLIFFLPFVILLTFVLVVIIIISRCCTRMVGSILDCLGRRQETTTRQNIVFQPLPSPNQPYSSSYINAPQPLPPSNYCHNPISYCAFPPTIPTYVNISPSTPPPYRDTCPIDHIKC